MEHHFSKLLFQSAAPFSHVVKHEGLAFISGIVGQRRDTGELVSNRFHEQCEAAFSNLATLLEETGLQKRNLLRLTVYVTTFESFELLNQAERRHLEKPFPSRTCIGAASLPLGALVQLDGIAALQGSADQVHFRHASESRHPGRPR